MPGGDGRGGLLGTLQGRCDYRDDVAVGQRVGDGGGLRRAGCGQVESGQPPVQDAGRVVHLTVAHHVDLGFLGHQAGLSWAAARAAAGSALAIRPNAASSKAAETNHASKALHGG
ncbi:Uncharacterised protein [Mycobacterium tuberculosis]|nr:Uncharacterised protein [Mycobacterium tuberculosis]